MLRPSQGLTVDGFTLIEMKHKGGFATCGKRRTRIIPNPWR